MDTVFKLVLVFFLSILTFSVGIYLGRQFTQAQHQKASLDLLEDGDERSAASIPTDATKHEPNHVISEEEIEKLSDDFVKQEKQNPVGNVTETGHAKAEENGKAEGARKAEGETSKAKKETAKKSAAISDEIAQVTKRIAAGEKVVPEPKEPSRIPSSLPKDLAGSTIGKFTVQVGSYAKEQEAQGKVDGFKTKGFSAFYVPAEVNGKTWYRVSIGQFTKKEEAVEYREKIMKEGGVGSAIVQKITK